MSRTGFATIGGITFHYAFDDLPPRPSLVFINSLGTDFRIWDAVTPHFANQFSILRYDKRGHGLSDSPPGPYSIHNHSDDLAGLLAYLKLESVILIGISVGGLIALDYTLRYPQTVRALVLADTGAKIGTSAGWSERIETVRAKGMEGMAEIIVSRWFISSFKQERSAEYRGYRNMVSRMPAEGYMATVATLRDTDLRMEASRIEAKTLVLCGTQDLPTPPELARELAGSIPNAHLEMIEQAAHLPCIEQPDMMAARIQHFFTEIGYGG